MLLDQKTVKMCISTTAKHPINSQFYILFLQAISNIDSADSFYEELFKLVINLTATLI